MAGWPAGWAPVYPRVCGGTYHIGILGAGQGGLSPRVRGNLAGTFAGHSYPRSIPACAGEPPPHYGLTTHWPVYPRVCGGTPRCVPRLRRGQGLSPRVRGNPVGKSGLERFQGSIPACAGEPDRRFLPSGIHAVYPRVCGGTAPLCEHRRDYRGLSPRVRGNHFQQGGAGGTARSIPACAGEPSARRGGQRYCRVYPRVCGGTFAFWRLFAPGRGLSPRVRGNLGKWGILIRRGGSIPACAGEPMSLRSYTEALAVYPRVCGGTGKHSGGVRPFVGLSPRVRGNPGDAPGRPAAGGSIPACAGEPQDEYGWRVWHWVYPRVCGGTVLRCRPGVGRNGLSPRVRGNLAR